MNIENILCCSNSSSSSFKERNMDSFSETSPLNVMEDYGWRSSLVQSLKTAWEEQLYTDLEIVTSDETFRAHKLVLAISSPYFKALLNNDFSESRSSVLKLSTVQGETMKVVLNYIYSGKAVLTDGVALDTLVLAEYFQIYDLKRLCSIYIKNHITSYSYLTIYEIALLHNCLDLSSYALKMAMEHCSEVINEPTFLSAQPSTLASLLQGPILDVSSEDDLLKAIRTWVNHKRQERSIFYSYLLTFLKEDQLSPVMKKVFEEELVKRTIETNFRLLDMKDRQSEKTAVRHKRGEELIFVLGGESCGRILGNVECSSMLNLNWRCSIPLYKKPKGIHYVEGQEVIPPMKYPRSHAAVTCKDNVIYLIGGKTTKGLLSSCETYHVDTNEWREIPDIPLSLHGCQATVLDDKLWVMGGTSDLKEYKESCLLMFDDKRNKWCYKAPMTTGRVHFGVASAYGCIFVFGGLSTTYKNGQRVITSCEKYDTESDTWIPIAPLGRGRAYHGVAVVDDLVYIIGGYSGTKWLNSVECYDPLTDRWTTVSSMMGCRSSFGIAVYDSRIYCIGGFNGESTLSSVIKYNPKTDMWHGEDSMHLRRYGLMSATLTLALEKLTPDESKNEESDDDDDDF